MKFIKRIFCKHNYRLYRNGITICKESDFSGDGCCNSWQERYTEYICTKCGKRKKIFNIN